MACFVDPLVSQLFQRLFQLLGSDEVRGFARQLVEGVDSELEELKTKLRMIGNLLNRAEDIQLMDGALKEWLDNLQHWAHDAEDVLDEFPYEALRRKLKVEPQESSSKGLSCLPGYFPGRLFNVNTGSEIKKINNRLEQLRQQRSAELNLQELSGVTSSNAALQRPEETSSVQPENFVYGRDEDIAKLVEIVKNEPTGGRNFRVITIVGMGGIGKTTVAREVYNHKELEGFKFEGKAWARVSFNFDILTISRSLLSLKGSMLSVPSDSNGLQVELQNAVSGKKFLIVLDDVWKVKYNDWEKLTSPFKAGAPGSTIIITTRDEDVAKTIRCSDSIYPLQLLSREACKSLFQEHALATGLAAYTDRITDTIHEKVIERCSGLPLAAKTLGGLLHSKSIDTWEKILDSKIWISSKENDILPVLKLSYLYLPSYLKRCFAYCAIFPEDYEFEEEELVFLWMAEGIIQPFDEQLNETGQYFRDLCSRSLFQKSNNYASKYVMHDLVHNLAESVFSKFSLRSEQAIIKLPENIEMIRHFSYVRWYIEGVFLIPHYMEGEKRFRGLEKLKNLRTFLPVFKRSDHYSNSQNYVSAIVLFDVLPQLKKLRVLSFERYQITHIPNSIGGLIHLRSYEATYSFEMLE
ncbi:putative disease resistance RPP13-like protein 1 [Mangifera indica]|uniref:putative disease resistance RPP13-like protein 1 n=1 Tax=Mangifera indica TaxID=29780 RepID=UPI001CFBFB45|nr:putative disease resistance RPP13-like protein 1 [Mangifera indica]